MSGRKYGNDPEVEQTIQRAGGKAWSVKHKFRLSKRDVDACEVFLETFSVRKAMERAGFPIPQVRSGQSKWFWQSKIQEYLNARAEQEVDKLMLRKFITVKTMLDIANADPTELFTDDGKLKKLNEIPKHLAKAIAGIDVGKRKNPDGGWDEIVKIRLVSKDRILETLARHQRLLEDFVPSNVQTQVITLPDKVPIGTPVRVNSAGEIVSNLPDTAEGDTGKKGGRIGNVTISNRLRFNKGDLK